jgi:hypothetical protein
LSLSCKTPPNTFSSSLSYIIPVGNHVKCLTTSSTAPCRMATKCMRLHSAARRLFLSCQMLRMWHFECQICNATLHGPSLLT